VELQLSQQHPYPVPNFVVSKISERSIGSLLIRASVRSTRLGMEAIQIFNCWINHPSFMKDLHEFWQQCCHQFFGDFALMKKLSLLSHKIPVWNK